MDMTPDHKEIVRRIRRSVHTVKGAGAVIGLSTVSGWGHTMEDFLDWLFEGANQITPDIVSLLMESGDLLAGIIANPRDPQKPRAAALKSRYGKIMGESGAEEPPAKPSSSEPAPDQDEAVPPPFAAEEQQLDVFSKVQTLRVGTERVDQIVNLISELMISASALERQMTIFTDVLGDLEISKDRLRGIAREMEREYEVKALESLKPVPGSKAPRPVSDPDALSQEFEDFDSLELDRYSKLSMIIRTLNESVIDVRTISNRMVNLFSDFDGHLTRQRVLLSEVQDKMMGIRMLPMGSLSNKLRRTVREISSKLKKKIRLVIEGEDIELDRMVWDKITDPLMHLLRNAADHGVERPDVRRKIGKPPTALIHLTASREGNQVVIRMTDDGGGLNYEGIRRKAIRGGFIREGSIISKKDLAALIFKPGLSTCDTISEVSGRGVGMDVVRENVQDLKGTVQVLSQESKGTQFIIRIPLTLAAVRALLFTLGPQIFAVALSEIREIVRASSDNLIRGPQDAVIIGNEILPLHPLRHLLHITGGSDESPSPIVLVVEAGGKREALEIDAIVGQQEIVIKNTGSHLRYIKGISGVTIIGDGGVVPILNVSELISGEAGVSGAIEGGAADFDAMTVREKPLSILVVDDSISIRQVISRLMEDQGWAVRTAKDGLDALDKLKEGRSDLIILDIEMPRMNGYELLGTLSEDPDFQNIPVVMLTSRATAKHRDKALSLGAKGFMGKPFKNDEFIDLIIQLTRSRR
jgi:chemosensory pili system protein ChpA (sensor histidine kinase/response regulator)